MQLLLNDKNLKFVDNYFRNYIKNYKIIRTQYSIRYKSKNLNISLTNEFIGPGLMNLINMLRIFVIKNFDKRSLDFVNEKDYFRNKILYRRIKNINDGIILNEYDKINAYLETLNKLIRIDNKLYNKLKSISKKSRLKVLGSLGTIKTIEYYENGYIINTEIKEHNELCRLTWLNIVYFTDLELNLYLDFFDKGFYYVDALFVDKNFENPEFKYKGNFKILNCKNNIIVLNDGRFYAFREKIDFKNLI